MHKRALITGGAGFIGSHVADELLRQGHAVRVLDCLSPQVHGLNPSRPAYLAPEAELVVGDVRDPDDVDAALDGVDVVFHLASMVGVGQSMYQIADYISVNELGTGVLLERLIKRPVERLIVASSISIYGEGLYQDADGSPVLSAERNPERLKARDFEPRDSRGRPLIPLPTPESKPPNLASVYALSKYAQERACLLIGQAYDIPTVALRFFNVYGTRQALSNPYTGVLAIFASRLLNGRPPRIFEDGQQRRDFVHVKDVASACALAMHAPGAVGRAINIGSGRHVSVREIAQALATVMGRPDIEPEITERCRVGDIRHCFSDIALARDVLGFAPRVSLADGLKELVAWLADQSAEDRVDQATRELQRHGLVA